MTVTRQDREPTSSEWLYIAFIAVCIGFGGLLSAAMLSTGNRGTGVSILCFALACSALAFLLYRNERRERGVPLW